MSFLKVNFKDDPDLAAYLRQGLLYKNIGTPIRKAMRKATKPYVDAAQSGIDARLVSRSGRLHKAVGFRNYQSRKVGKDNVAIYAGVMSRVRIGGTDTKHNPQRKSRAIRVYYAPILERGTEDVGRKKKPLSAKARAKYGKWGRKPRAKRGGIVKANKFIPPEGQYLDTAAAVFETELSKEFDRRLGYLKRKKLR